MEHGHSGVHGGVRVVARRGIEHAPIQSLLMEVVIVQTLVQVNLRVVKVKIIYFDSAY